MGEEKEEGRAWMDTQEPASDAVVCCGGFLPAIEAEVPFPVLRQRIQEGSIQSYYVDGFQGQGARP